MTYHARPLVVTTALGVTRFWLCLCIQLKRLMFMMVIGMAPIVRLHQNPWLAVTSQARPGHPRGRAANGGLMDVHASPNVSASIRSSDRDEAGLNERRAAGRDDERREGAEQQRRADEDQRHAEIHRVAAQPEHAARRQPGERSYFFSSLANTVCLIVGSTSSRFFCETTMIGTRTCFGGVFPSR